MKCEIERIESLSKWYTSKQLEFDKVLIRLRYETIKKYFTGDDCLELGPAEGQMTQFLINDFKNLTVIEGSESLLKLIPNNPRLTKVHSLFENYNPNKLFDMIIIDHVLEHVDNPIELLKLIKNWLNPFGKIIIGVPNANSIHRLVAVKMGILNNQSDLNSRDIALGHRRVYSHDTLINDVKESGLVENAWGGVFFKPLSNSQIQECWDFNMINGFYELGKDFPEFAAELFVVCSK